MDKNKTILHAWLDFWLCFFLGGLGVHKFREGKIVWGLVYLFTFGILSFGWTRDCIAYFYVAVRITLENSFSNNGASSAEDKKATHMRTGKIIGLCLVIAWLLLLIGISACASTVPSPDPQTSSSEPSDIIEPSDPESSSQDSSEEESESSDTSEPEPSENSSDSSSETHAHSFEAATCTAPKKCSECGETEGSALGHKWQAAPCASPTKCSVCGETDGNPLEHSWTEATCTSAKKCSVCGET